MGALPPVALDPVVAGLLGGLHHRHRRRRQELGGHYGMASDHSRHGHGGTLVDTLTRVSGILAARPAPLLRVGSCGLGLHQAWAPPGVARGAGGSGELPWPTAHISLEAWQPREGLGMSESRETEMF